MLDDLIVYLAKLSASIGIVMALAYILLNSKEATQDIALNTYLEGIKGFKFYNKFDFTGLNVSRYQKDAVNSYADPAKYKEQIANILKISKKEVAARIK